MDDNQGSISVYQLVHKIGSYILMGKVRDVNDQVTNSSLAVTNTITTSARSMTSLRCMVSTDRLASSYMALINKFIEKEESHSSCQRVTSTATKSKELVARVLTNLEEEDFEQLAL